MPAHATPPTAGMLISWDVSMGLRGTVNLTDVTDGNLQHDHDWRAVAQLSIGMNSDYRSWVRGNNAGSGATKNIAVRINSTVYNGSNNFNDISMNHTNGGELRDGRWQRPVRQSGRFACQSRDRLQHQWQGSRTSARLSSRSSSSAAAVGWVLLIVRRLGEPAHVPHPKPPPHFPVWIHPRPRLLFPCRMWE